MQPVSRRRSRRLGVLLVFLGVPALKKKQKEENTDSGGEIKAVGEGTHRRKSVGEAAG